MSTHIERVTASTVAPAILRGDDLADGEAPLAADHVGLTIGDVVLIEGTHDELRTLLTGGLALVDHDARALDTAARDAAEAEAEAGQADRMTWGPGDVIVTPPPTGGQQ